METFKAHYKANGLQRDIPDIKAGLTHRPPVSHTHPPPTDSPLLSLSPHSLTPHLSLSPANPNQQSVCETGVPSSEVLLCDGSGVCKFTSASRDIYSGEDFSSFFFFYLPHQVCSGGSNIILILGADEDVLSQRKE